MAEWAAHQVDHVLPAVGVRQWVLTLPWGRRFLLARYPELIRGALGIATTEIFRWVREDLSRRGFGGGQTGSVTVVQRFGSALRLNVHFHILVLDGCYSEDADGQLTFHRAYKPTTADVQELVTRISVAIEHWLALQGHGPDDAVDSDPDDGQELLQAASLAGKVGLGRRAGQRSRRVVLLGGREFALPRHARVSCNPSLNTEKRLYRLRDRAVHQRHHRAMP